MRNNLPTKSEILYFITDTVLPSQQLKEYLWTFQTIREKVNDIERRPFYISHSDKDYLKTLLIKPPSIYLFFSIRSNLSYWHSLTHRFMHFLVRNGTV